MLLDVISKLFLVCSGEPGVCTGFVSSPKLVKQSKTQLLSALWFYDIWDCDFLCLLPKCQSLHSQWYICSNKSTESLNWQHLIPSSMGITLLRAFYPCRNSPVTPCSWINSFNKASENIHFPDKILRKGDVPFPTLPLCVQKIPVIPAVYVTEYLHSSNL